MPSSSSSSSPSPSSSSTNHPLANAIRLLLSSNPNNNDTNNKDNSDKDWNNDTDSHSHNHRYSHNNDYYGQHQFRSMAIKSADIIEMERDNALFHFWKKRGYNISNGMRKSDNENCNNGNGCSDAYNDNNSDDNNDKVNNDCDDDGGTNNFAIDRVRIVSNQSKTSISKLHNDNYYDTNDIKTSSSSSSSVIIMTPLEFKKQYVYKCIPCLVLGLGLNDDDISSSSSSSSSSDNLNSFNTLSQMWTTSFMHDDNDKLKRNKNNDKNNNQSRKRIVQSSWFLDQIGYTSNVPVRVTTNNRSDRNEECLDNDTADDKYDDERNIKVTLGEWINKLRGTSSSTTTMSSVISLSLKGEPQHNHRCHYLKDWHLQSILERKQQQNKKHGQHYHYHASTLPPYPSPFSSLSIPNINGMKTTISQQPPLLPLLYNVPEIFSPDVLHDHLLSHVYSQSSNYHQSSPKSYHNNDHDDDDNNDVEEFDLGDYRFVYWGSKGSTTSSHIDVMGSHSWSYNVSGIKEWTFYPPPLPFIIYINIDIIFIFIFIFIIIIIIIIIILSNILNFSIDFFPLTTTIIP